MNRARLHKRQTYLIALAAFLCGALTSQATEEEIKKTPYSPGGYQLPCPSLLEKKISALDAVLKKAFAELPPRMQVQLRDQQRFKFEKVVQEGPHEQIREVHDVTDQKKYLALVMDSDSLIYRRWQKIYTELKKNLTVEKIKEHGILLPLYSYTEAKKHVWIFDQPQNSNTNLGDLSREIEEHFDSLFSETDLTRFETKQKDLKNQISKFWLMLERAFHALELIDDAGIDAPLLQLENIVDNQDGIWITPHFVGELISADNEITLKRQKKTAPIRIASELIYFAVYGGPLMRGGNTSQARNEFWAGYIMRYEEAVSELHKSMSKLRQMLDHDLDEKIESKKMKLQTQSVPATTLKKEEEYTPYAPEIKTFQDLKIEYESIANENGYIDADEFLNKFLNNRIKHLSIEEFAQAVNLNKAFYTQRLWRVIFEARLADIRAEFNASNEISKMIQLYFLKNNYPDVTKAQLNMLMRRLRDENRDEVVRYYLLGLFTTRHAEDRLMSHAEFESYIQFMSKSLREEFNQIWRKFYPGEMFPPSSGERDTEPHIAPGNLIRLRHALIRTKAS